jgi:3-deoxy-D-manno-octulosonic-acid transferase
VSVLFVFFYNLIFLPLFYLSLLMVFPFNSKIRKGLLGRMGMNRRIRKIKKQIDNHPLLVLHCASMGEFEHTKPFLLEFKKSKPDFRILILFFSPSGFENVKPFPAVDFYLYSPHECFFLIWRFFRQLKPTLWIIAKHDVWPNQIWLARWFKVPIFLINASLYSGSKRLFWFTKPFYRAVYNNFNLILATSDADRENFCRLVDPDVLTVIGDTKFDQVIYRQEESRKKEIIPHQIVEDRWILVAGSTWPEDHVHLIPALQNLHRKYQKMLSIICPHEPTSAHLAEIKSYLIDGEFILLSEIQNFSNQKYLIVDRFGLLANLYSLGKLAYIGGSFKQNIHNMLEAAVYQIPVLFGPVNQVLYEAQLLKNNMGGWEVRNSQEIQNVIEKFLDNDIFRQECGRKAYKIVEENRGATQRTIEKINDYLENKT